MTAWYEFEEHVGRWWHHWAASAISYPEHPEAEVRFEDLRDTLAVYFRAMGGGRSLALVTASAQDSRHRLTLRQRLGLEAEPMERARRDAENVVLPARMALFPQAALNRDVYFWLAAFLAEVRQLPAPADPLQCDLIEIAEAARASDALCERLPGLAVRYRRLCAVLLDMRPERALPPIEADVEALIRHLLGQSDALVSPGRLLRRIVAGEELARYGAPSGYRPPLPVPLWGYAWTDETTSPAASQSDPEIDQEAASDSDGVRRKAERRRLDQTERDDPLMLNPFEKMLSWSEMVNVNRPIDDNQEDDARQAADQLERITVTQHERKAASRLKMELELAGTDVDASPLSAPRTYPEWHYRKNRYLEEYCAVYAQIAPEMAPNGEPGAAPDAEARRRINRVRRQFEALRPRRELQHHHVDGDEIDLDALVQSIAERAAGGHPSENVYLRWRDQTRDLAVATLVDVSLSTDAWVADRRVLDVEKEALLALAHGVQACGDDQAIYTFTSRRRHRVDIRQIKGFEEPVTAATERRIAALEPGLYTRMGAAIRHVAGELGRRPNRHRLLLVLTDGKPNDTDHYEGRFAVEDTRMAVREARREGLAVFGVTIDAEARQYFPAIFDRSGYAIVTRPAGLANALPLLYRQLIR
ncbi:nitric oxide reductase activation protein NorD [Ectothiorhodospira lacustris]|uniref:nitric oxide reductase activation protein NorD n=1 Tax=Ectothiorhodospira lacustris TaxID=2899127 RepID=UPI001EE7AE28|nr:VWA domain-containing protein [Ectothiorhodospira lacustris]MCG5511430.1 VWA domain-containing protein [Ectothiorhodospira lacustris]MCG5523169.1 VWA domain-containing protein [Ectothiorhodospira lacustris]